MRRRPHLTALWLLGLLALPALAQQSRPQLSDKGQKFALWFTDAATEFPDKETIVFDVSGNPVRGYSKSQNLEFSSSNMEGRLRKLPNGDMLLTRGTASGSATMTITDSDGASTFKSAKVSIEDDGESATVTVPGTFTFTNSSATEDGAKRALTMNAASGSFVLKSLSKKDENPLTTATVNGPVSVKVDAVDKAGRMTLYTLTGSRMTMRAEGTDKVVTLVGNVHLTSDETGPDQKGFMGEMDVSQATVVFDKDYAIKKISTKGSPGTGTLRDKSGG